MNINLLPFTVLWMILSLTVIGLLVYRKWVSREEDDSLHVLEAEASVVMRQAALAPKLQAIDRWGKALTVIALLYGLLVGVAYLYQQWIAASKQVFS